MASPPTPTTGALTVNATSGVILSPITAALFKSANGISDGGSSVIANDDTTNATMYPVWVTANTGTLPLYVASGKMNFNPSTGLLSSVRGLFGGIGLTAQSITNAATLTSPALTDMLVGTGTFGTSFTLASATGIPTFSTNVVFSGTTLSVPDAFVVSSAGSIGLTAGGSDKGITITPSGGGTLGVGFTPVTNRARLVVTNPGVASAANLTTWVPAANTVTFVSDLDASTQVALIGASGNGAALFFRSSAGTLAVPVAKNNGTQTSLITFSTFDGTGFQESASIRTQLTATPVAGTSAPQKIVFRTAPTAGGSVGDVVSMYPDGYLEIGPSRSLAAWGTTGSLFRAFASTSTNNSTAVSGTVATAVFSSFGIPTLAATNATVTTTNAANVYIAGDVATGTNQTLTNSYGLWNVGKTRLDGGVTVGGTAQDGLTAPLVSVNKNGSVPNATQATSDAQTGIRVFGASATQSSIINHGFQAIPVITGLAANGTAASPTDTTSALGALVRFQGGGWANSAWRFPAEMLFVPLENWSASTYATSAEFRTTPLTSTTRSTTLTISGGPAATLTGGAGNMTITAGTGASRTLTFQTTTSGSAATTALTLGAAQQATFAGAIIATPQALSGAGAVDVVATSTFYTSTGAAQALTLANGTAGQIKTIVHQVDGGSGVLTPTSKIGFTTITFTNVGDSATLQYTAAGWAIVGIFGAVAA